MERHPPRSGPIRGRNVPRRGAGVDGHLGETSLQGRFQVQPHADAALPVGAEEDLFSIRRPDGPPVIGGVCGQPCGRSAAYVNRPDVAIPGAAVRLRKCHAGTVRGDARLRIIARRREVSGLSARSIEPYERRSSGGVRTVYQHPAIRRSAKRRHCGGWCVPDTIHYGQGSPVRRLPSNSCETSTPSRAYRITGRPPPFPGTT